MKSLLALFFTTAALCTFACSAGSGGPGSASTAGGDLPPISGDSPPISGERPPTSGDPSPGNTGAGLVCDGLYTCSITQNGKSGNNVIKLKCDAFVNGNIVEKGKVIGSYSVNFDGSFTATATDEKGRTVTLDCTPGGVEPQPDTTPSPAGQRDGG
jgi:hypothetical protein